MGNLIAAFFLLLLALAVLGWLIEFVQRVFAQLEKLFGVQLTSTSNLVANAEVGSEEDFSKVQEKHATQLSEFLKKISGGHGAYYVDNKTMDFLEKAFEGNVSCPSGYYSRWIVKPDVPGWLKEYGGYVRSEIDKKHTAVRDEKKRAESQRNKEVAEKILFKNSEKIGKFLEIAYRRVSAVDDYGDENPAALTEEIRRFVKKISETEPELHQELTRFGKKTGDWDLHDYFSPIRSQVCISLQEQFEKYYAVQKSKSPEADIESVANMTGVEFEQFLVRLLKDCGVKDEVRPGNWIT